MSISTTRSRWAAIGAAVAVTLGAGGVALVDATEPAGASAFVPIEPCRLAENAVIGADASITLAGWGSSGACTLPNDITGLAANVTAVGATDQTNLRFYAEGATVPETANLNPSPGAAPTPNAVNITLNDTNGQFSVYNRFGDVAVFIDVMGYYTDHHHDDRYYTETEVDAALAEKADDPGVIVINALRMSPGIGTTGWSRSLGYSHSATATDECIEGFADLPAGATIDGVAVEYRAATAAQLDVGVLVLLHDVGPVSSEEELLKLAVDEADLDVPVAEPFTRAELTVTPTVIDDGESAFVSVCTSEAMLIWSVIIELA